MNPLSFSHRAATKLCAIAVIASACCHLLSDQHAAAQTRDTGKPWIDMDYGPYMTHSFEASRPAGNIAYKGVKIRLGEAGQAMLFDTDLLRWAAGWHASDLDWKSVVYDGSHNTHPHVLSEPAFANPVAPGWARDGAWDDPRKLPYGPLPRDWAHWKGLYLHGDSVVLSYTVGDASVLETPSRKAAENTEALVRSLQIGKSSEDLILQVAFNSRETVRLVAPKSSSEAPSNSVAESIAVFGAPQKKEVAAIEPDDEDASLSKQLVAHWTFDEAQTDEPLANAASKQFHGTLRAGVKPSAGANKGGLHFSGEGHVALEDGDKLRLDQNDWTIAAWIKTTRGGTIVARGPAAGKWKPRGKTFFVRGGRLCFDIGWVGVVQSQKTVADGRWHHVAVVSDHATGRKRLFIDGEAAGQKKLASEDDPDHVVRIGYTATNFVPPFRGQIDDARVYSRALGAEEIRKLAGGAAAAPSLAAFACRASSPEVTWDRSEPHHLRLKIPAGATPLRLNIAHWHGPGDELPSFQALVKELAPPGDLAALTQGGPRRWQETVTTKAKVGEGDGPFVKDEITLPRDNPWKSWIRPGGFDFFADGTRAAVGTWSGDVWIVDGLGGNLGELKWRRVASGMFQPLGVRIVDDEIYVCCRDQITRLHDLNGDGEIDFYENFNNDHQVTEHFHEFAMDLQTDADGNFYYAKSARHAKKPVVPHHGTLIRVSPDGKTSEIVCNGFRAANGVGVGPRGQLATSDQEGHWTPANRINLVKPGGFYGNMWSYHVGEEPTDYDPPVVWLPKNVDRSPAAQLWVPEDAWGPLGGKMIHTSYGTGWLWHVMYEHVDGVPQGGVVRLPVQFPTGIMRGRFHPRTRHLYACGLVGWSSSQPIDGGFYRVRYTGAPLHLPAGLHVRDDGIELTFAEKLDPKTAADYGNWGVEQWNYKWTANYGSAHYSVSNPRKRGQDEVEVWDVTLSDDGKTVFLEMEDLQPVMQMQIRYNITAADGTELEDSVWLTINKVP